MSFCPLCKHPMRDQDRLSGAEFDTADDITGLYSCGICSTLFVVMSDGSTAAADVEIE